MRTVQEIFDIAIHLIDAQNENNGNTVTSDTKEYQVRACELLNSLMNEAYPCSDTYAEEVEGHLAGEAYAKGEKVDYDGGKYVCIATETTATPTDATAWQKVATVEAGKRPTHVPVKAMTDLVDMDDFICLSALPAGLAALFVYDEDTTKYNAYWGDYQDRLRQARERMPAGAGDDGYGFESIFNPYGSLSRLHGGIEHGQFGRWPY